MVQSPDDKTGNVGIGTTAPGSKLDVNGQMTQSTRSIRAVFEKSGIADNTATAMFRIVTPTGKSGFYSVVIHVLSGTSEGSATFGSNAASKISTFHRTVAGSAGTGTSSAVTDIATIGPTNEGGAGYDPITSISITTSEVNEYTFDVFITNDNSANHANVAYALLSVELVWDEFAGIAPTLTAQ